MNVDKTHKGESKNPKKANLRWVGTGLERKAFIFLNLLCVLISVVVFYIYLHRLNIEILVHHCNTETTLNQTVLLEVNGMVTL